MLAHGFTIEMLIVLVRDGFATATPEIVHAGRRPIEFRRALEKAVACPLLGLAAAKHRSGFWGLTCRAVGMVHTAA